MEEPTNLASATNPTTNVIVKPAENLADAPFNAQDLINQAVNPPEPPLELSPPVDPWTLPTTIGVADDLGASVGAVEVGGAGTGTWVWLSPFAVGNPIAAGALLVLGLAAIAGAVWWGASTPSNASKAQIDARSDIANNPLPDNIQPFKDATKAPPVGSRIVFNAQNDALAAEDQCIRRFVACTAQCPGELGADTAGCIQACGTCDAEDAAVWKQIERDQTKIQTQTDFNVGISNAPVRAPTILNEASLQRQRMNALSRGDMDTYNRLIQQHRALYRENNVDPCASSFFPQGCSH
jgi:hypothetical protein